MEKRIRKRKKTQEWLNNHGLSGLSPEYLDTVKSIANMGTSATLIDLGTSLSGKPEEAIKSYLSIIVEQNWMIIRLLNDIANNQK